MKPKHIALPIRVPETLQLAPIPQKKLYTTRCFSWSYLGIQDPSANWHKAPATPTQKREVATLSTMPLSRLPGEKAIVFEWELGDTQKQMVFQHIFQETNANGYLVYLNFSNKALGHVLALKYRDNHWRMMDPTVVHIHGRSWYMHAQLNTMGQMRIGSCRNIDVAEYIFQAYPDTNRIGVIVFRSLPSSITP